MTESIVVNDYTDRPCAFHYHVNGFVDIEGDGFICRTCGEQFGQAEFEGRVLALETANSAAHAARIGSPSRRRKLKDAAAEYGRGLITEQEWFERVSELAPPKAMWRYR